MNEDQQALLDVIQAMKPDGVSDLEAALNIITHHAATIKGLQRAVDDAERRAANATAALRKGGDG